MIIVSPDGSVVVITPDDIEYAMQRLIKRKSTLLDYRTSTAEKYYGKTNLNWVQLETRAGLLRAPYDLIVDYRQWSKGLSWGEVDISGEYAFPTELSEHRYEMIELLRRKGQLKGGNNQCPRIRSMHIQDSRVPKYSVERAWYFDQVGTNLTLDYPLDSPISVNGFDQYTVRDWDITQSGLTMGYLPDMKSSKLANTIGIAIGITAETKSGQTVIIIRKRSKKVAVYPNMLHLPFSFALSPPQEDFIHGDLMSIIKFDLGHEQASELGLEPTDLDELTPVAFCRDLIRGGKPQFFFEQHSRISFEDLCENIRESTPVKEYKSGVIPIGVKSQVNGNFSPELLCFLLLKAHPY
ncbi:hypothetical protein ACFLU4_05425 [Chloroflexota bacterium]